MERAEIVEKLKTGICEVVFVKTDGSTRVMKATLMESVLDDMCYSNSERVINPNTVSVIDVEKNHWRSFNIDSVKSFKAV